MKYCYALILATMCLFQVLAQQTELDNKSIGYLGFDYASNTNTFGVTVNEVKQPSFLFSGSYLSKYNFDLNYSYFLTDNADSNYSKPAEEHNLGLGYNLQLTERISIYPSYTHLIHSKNSYALKSIFNDIAQTDLFYNTNYYSSALTLSYLWGQNNMFYGSWYNAAEITFEKFLHPKAMLNLQLGMGINYSDNNYYNKVLYDNWGYEDFTSWIRQNYPRRAEILIERIGIEGFDIIKNYIYTQNESLFTPDYTFTTLDFMLPAYYYLNDISFSFTVYLHMPISENALYEQYTSLMFMAGIGYIIQ